MYISCEIPKVWSHENYVVLLVEYVEPYEKEKDIPPCKMWNDKILLMMHCCVKNGINISSFVIELFLCIVGWLGC